MRRRCVGSCTSPAGPQRLSLVVVAARRLGEPSAHEALLDELAAVRGAQRLEPAPLSAAAAGVLAEEAFSMPAESGVRARVPGGDGRQPVPAR